MIEKEGYLSLFNGLKSSLVLVSNPIIQYSVYENLKYRCKGNFFLKIC